MKIDVNALLQLGVLSFTILGGWIAFLKRGKPEKSNKDKCAELIQRVESIESANQKLETKMNGLRTRQNKIIQRFKDKNSFN